MLTKESKVVHLATVCLSTIAASHGLGRHTIYLSAANLTAILYYSTISVVLGVAAICLPKLAVVILLIKLMGPRQRGQWFLYGMLIILFITSAMNIIVVFVQCDRFSHLWHPSEPAKCWSPLVLKNVSIISSCSLFQPFPDSLLSENRKADTTGAFFAFVDLCLALFPTTIFWDLNMRTSKKVSLSLLMGLGIL